VIGDRVGAHQAPSTQPERATRRTSIECYERWSWLSGSGIAGAISPVGRCGERHRRGEERRTAAEIDIA